METKKTKKELIEEIERLNSFIEDKKRISDRLDNDLTNSYINLAAMRSERDELRGKVEDIVKTKEEEKKAIRAKLESELEQRNKEIERLSYKPSFLDNAFSLMINIAGIVSLCAVLYWRWDIFKGALCVVIACLILSDWLPPTHRKMEKRKVKDEQEKK